MIKEKLIKAALIDWLYAKGLVSDAVIINEMVVSNWARRADIAVANGRLYGFEIKSEFDSLKRLPGQIESFQRHFDKVTVVAASKFIPDIVSAYPSEVGILEVCIKGSGFELRQVRPGRISEVRDSMSIASLMTKVEIERLLKVENVSFESGLTRKELVRNLSSVSVRRLKSYALDALKKRYRETFLAFDSARLQKGSLESLNLLSRSESLRVKIALAADLPVSFFKKSDLDSEQALDFSGISEEFGAMPDYMPQTVLLRRKSN
ncbi:sce7726 family protein [Pseudomonas viridiflava]|uniref:sce7726 family protein n=2 Tax=Pseudomonas viridiflava TaxID=33069 RepID=UPI000F03CF67|nr:sce7726 family protein [Pseudomonas viridiflava]